MPSSAGREGRTFAGAVAIVTGGASGIGRALGAELYRQGADVVLTDIDAQGVDRAVERIRSSLGGAPGSIAGQVLDVRDGDAVERVVRQTASDQGRLDLMFNNAGIATGGPTEDLRREHWERIVDVNLHGVVNGVSAAYPLMITQGHGHIVNTASGAGLAPVVLTAAYTATKYAVVGLSSALRPEAASHGVRVSALCPGAIDTPILDRGSPADLPPMSPGSLTGREFMKRLGVHLMSAERFAPRALHGVARNQAIIVVPRSAKALWYLHRLSPGATERISRLMLRRVGPRTFSAR